MLLRYAFRELRNSPRFCLLFCLNMTLGLTGFIALDAMKRSFEDKLQSSAKNMMAADLTVSARRELKPDESQKLKDALPSGTRQLEMLTLYSMVTSPKRSVLVELKGIDQGFPFYGEITLEKKGVYQGSQPLELLTAPKVWVVPELLVQLDVKAGETVRIGSLDFVVDDVVQDDSSAAMIGASMAPRIYVGRNALNQSGLLQFGSTTTHTQLIQLPAGSDVDQVEEGIQRVITDAGVRVSAYNKAGQDNGRMLAYLSDYLGLVSLVALALAAMAAIQKHAHAHGFSVVRDFVGHGIGKNFHEDPQIFHYGEAGRGVRLEAGMVFTIEPMINEGDWRTKVKKDGWTAVTLDGSLSAQFEHTLAIRSDGRVEILTVRD
jgi:predicted lysophospholipase L1 biosynthesis ABC-type transport system permease subunit